MIIRVFEEMLGGDCFVYDVMLLILLIYKGIE